ncbi:Putative transcriptional regulator DJ-1 [Ceraceosorus bombacis]|uniref:D-lactate dehydratase n=1 Tax=Ceraceosorus bombacis TaxID=401625 RepID=A0A0P1BCD6_9BASI|nr:Putative transcriptional regulator DJ-1 [Ceraceosorus bombacis]
MTAPRALIFIAQGTEETEFVATYDVLVRGGVQVTSVHVGSSNHNAQDPHAAELVKCSRGVLIKPDKKLDELAGKALEYDAFIVPGGNEGSATISANEDVQALLSAAYGKGKVVAAICAGSLAIKAAGVAKDSPITSHPSVKDQLDADYHYKEDSVVVSDKLITSRGPGTSLHFGLAIVEALQGKEKRDEIEKPLMLPSNA